MKVGSRRPEFRNHRPKAKLQEKKTIKRATILVAPLFSGGAERDRTVDLMTASHALSQLSYSPFFWFNIANGIIACQYDIDIFFRFPV